MQITGVTSQVSQGESSDDDVIEVVRDEAPIEILSDGEEIELEKSRHESVIQNFHFTNTPVESPGEEKDINVEDDPLKSFTSLTDCNSSNGTTIDMPPETNIDSQSKSESALNHEIVTDNENFIDVVKDNLTVEKQFGLDSINKEVDSNLSQENSNGKSDIPLNKNDENV